MSDSRVPSPAIGAALPAEARKDYDRIYEADLMAPSEANLYRKVAQRCAQFAPAGHVLDVACGPGAMMLALAAEGLRVEGIDLSDVAVNRARELVPAARVVSGSAENLPWADQSFDAATCMGSLEHFPNPDAGAAEIRRVLKPHGRAYILLPNSHFIGDFFNVWRYGTAKKNLQPIERFAARLEWQAFLEGNGLDVISAEAYNERRPIRSFAHLAYAVLRPLIPLDLSYCFLFTCVAK